MNSSGGTFSTQEFALGFADASPSELLHNSDTQFICIAVVYFFFVKRSKLKQISQFKKTRGLKRKLQTQNYIIESIENGLIAPAGISNWNERSVALENGKHILNQAGIVTEEKQYSDLIEIGQEKISYGHCVSLGWYSIVLSTFLKYIGQIAKIENKPKVAILLDLLPGDRIHNLRSLNVVQEIIDNSVLEEFQVEAIDDNKLEIIGYAYGQKEGTTKGIKNDFEYVITDWIVQSFYSLLVYEKENLNKTSNEYQLSRLAKYLLDKGVFTIRNAFKLV
jgi:hypothetical protein